MANINKSKGEFDIIFKVAPSTSFEVQYYRCSTNEEPYFATSAAVFTRNNVGCVTRGQCQKRALAGNSLFYRFFNKWSPKHLQRLTTSELKKLADDVSELKNSGAPYLEAADGASERFCSNKERKVLGWKPHKAYRIKWDTDGATYKECGLPTSVIVPFGLDGDEVADWLSDTYGFCHDGFCTNFEDEYDGDCEK